MAGRCTRWLAAVAARRRAYRMRHEKHAPLRMMLMIPLTGKLAGYKFTSPRAVHGVLHGPSTRVVRRTDSTNWFTDILTHRMDSIKASGRNQRSAGSATAVVADGFLETQWSLLQSRRKHALFLRHRHSLRNPTGRAEPAGDLRRLDVTLRVRFRRVHGRHPFANCSMNVADRSGVPDGITAKSTAQAASTLAAQTTCMCSPHHKAHKGTVFERSLY